MSVFPAQRLPFQYNLPKRSTAVPNLPQYHASDLVTILLLFLKLKGHYELNHTHFSPNQMGFSLANIETFLSI